MQIEVEPCTEQRVRGVALYWSVMVNDREEARCPSHESAARIAKLLTGYYASWSYVWLFSLTKVRHAFRARDPNSICGTFERKFARMAVYKPLDDCGHCKRIIKRASERKAMDAHDRRNAP